MESEVTARAGPESTGIESGEEHEVPRLEPPRIYVASLSDYNAGYLHGVWLAADHEPDELGVAVSEMLASSPSDPRAEEFAIHDFENFGQYRPSEYDSLDWISRIAKGITEQGPAYGAWAEQCDHDEDRLNKFDEAFLGEWESTEHYAEELLTDLGYVDAVERALPESMQRYVSLNFAGFANDLLLGGDISAMRSTNDGVWLFEGNV